jgi:hypothetical protein
VGGFAVRVIVRCGSCGSRSAGRATSGWRARRRGGARLSRRLAEKKKRVNAFSETPTRSSRRKASFPFQPRTPTDVEAKRRFATRRAFEVNIHVERANARGFLGRDARVGTWRRARRDARSRTHLELAHERGFRVGVLVQGSALARERDARPRRRAPRLLQKLTRHPLGRRLRAHFPLGPGERPRLVERAARASLVVRQRGRVGGRARAVERERHGRARVVQTRATWSETRPKSKK